MKEITKTVLNASGIHARPAGILVKEIKKYASSIALYNEAMQEYSKKYAREHRSLPQPRTKYW